MTGPDRRPTRPFRKQGQPCLFNPTQVTEKLQVNWKVGPGLSHQVLQFQSTSNRQLTGVEFYLDRFFATEQPGDPNILEFRAFLRNRPGMGVLIAATVSASRVSSS